MVLQKVHQYASSARHRGRPRRSTNHHNLYYTKAEISTQLLEKANAGHTHDSRYYLKTEVDGFLNGKAAATH